jgi:hypothetical protein
VNRLDASSNKRPPTKKRLATKHPFRGGGSLPFDQLAE